MDQIPYSPPLDYNFYASTGDWVLVFTHGERTDVSDEIFKSMRKELVKSGISVFTFRLPFRMQNKKHPDATNVLDDSYITAFNHALSLPEASGKRFVLSGHSVGAATALRVSGLVTATGEIPPVVALSYPMFPPNRPEKMNVTELGAIMGPVLFCTGDKGNRGTHDRLMSQLAMVANFAETNLIKGGNHDLKVDGKPDYLIGRWLANDISVFLSRL